MSYYMKKHNREYKRRNKGKYITLSSRKPKTKKKYSEMVKKGAKMVKGYVQGANDGLDGILGIPKKEPDFGLATRVPKGYKLVKKRKPTNVPKGYKLVKMRKRR